MSGSNLVVTLNLQELVMAAQVGTARQIDSLRRGSMPATSIGYEGPGWDIHVEGAAGEMAYAKAMQIYWAGDVGTFKAPDFPGRVQVRTRSGKDGRTDLIVRDGDDSGDYFVLVIGRAPTFTVVGWRDGTSCKNPQWTQTYGGRPAAFFVPKEEVWPFPIDYGEDR